MKYTEHEIINHGYCHSDYFQGCGTYGTKFSEVVTGAGSNAKEAYEDACEQIYQSFHWINLPDRPRGINAKDKVPAKEYSKEENSCYWYVSIRFNCHDVDK